MRWSRMRFTVRNGLVAAAIILFCLVLINIIFVIAESRRVQESLAGPRILDLEARHIIKRTGTLMAWAPDGSALATNSPSDSTSSLIVWNRRTGRTLKSVHGAHEITS